MDWLGGALPGRSEVSVRIPPFRVGVCGGFTPALKITEHAVLALGSKGAAQAGGTISAFGA